MSTRPPVSRGPGGPQEENMVSIHSRNGGGYGYDDGYEDAPEAPSSSLRFAQMVRRLGAVLSIAMIIGVVVWGYRLSVRQITGLPVIHALPGPARIAPDDPGGDMARHVGLSVNEVASNGMAAPGPDRVMLAPDPERLAATDGPMSGVTEIPQVKTADPVLPEEATPANQPTAEVPEGSAIAVDGDSTPAADPEDGIVEPGAADPPGPVAVVPAPEQPYQISTDAPDDLVPDSVPGVKTSPRPVERPFAAKGTEAAPAAPGATDAPAPAAAAGAKPAATVADDELASVPDGTRVVQLGAFDSAESARAEWDRIAKKFPPQMKGRKRMVQEAISGGRKFYRLRVVGFNGLDEARSFCATLVAGGANCIPTVAH